MRWAAVTAVEVLGARAATAPPAEVAQALRLAEAVSAACERMLERAIAPRRAAARFAARAGSCRFRSGSADYRYHELLALEDLRLDLDGDGVPETATSEYTLVGDPPYRAVALPRGYTGTVLVTGWWGMADEQEPAGALAAAVSPGDTAFSLAGDGGLQPGHTVVLGGERCYVTAVSGAAATVLRGQRGTSAAAHPAGTPLTREVYPAAISAACLVEAVRLLRDGLTGYAGSVGPADLALGVQAIYPALVDLRRTYHPTGAAAV